MQAIVIDKTTGRVKERYEVLLQKVDTGFEPSNFKGGSLHGYTEAAMSELRSTGKHSTTFEVLGFLAEFPDKHNPDLVEGGAKIHVQTCNIPKEILSILLEPVSTYQKTQGKLGVKFEFEIKRLT